MANPTTNFGWQMPQNTDLVKDLPADFEVFGQAVDTDLADLKGGTTGQILSKTSNTDLDFTWINNDQGDITEVQAGTGISVASGTGPVPVITNTVATEFDAKGDLIVGTGSDTFDRLAVGTNGYTLVADSSTSTGLKWASSGAMTQLVSSTSLGTGTQVNITSISQDYRNLRLIIKDWSQASGGSGGIRISLANTTDTGFGGTFFDYRNTLYGTRSNSGLTYFELGTSLYYTVNGTYIIDIFEYASTTKKFGIAVGSGQDGGSNADGGFFANIQFPQTNAISAIYLRSNTAFDNGTYELWGIK